MNTHFKSTLLRVTIMLLIAILIIALFRLYRKYYAYPKSGDDYFLYQNPLRPDQEDFDRDFSAAETCYAKGDIQNAMTHYQEALKYRGSFNEHQFQRVFSDANDYWNYETGKMLKYKRCYEMTGNLDSALTCMAPAMMITGFNYTAFRKEFFSLLLKKRGKTYVIAEIAKGLSAIMHQECTQCAEYYYPLAQFHVGLTGSETMLAKTDKQALAKSLYKEYGIIAE